MASLLFGFHRVSLTHVNFVQRSTTPPRRLKELYYVLEIHFCALFGLRKYVYSLTARIIYSRLKIIILIIQDWEEWKLFNSTIEEKNQQK